ncbi:type II toxin-antitoxin system RelE/ParE family toxin [bacterium]|nr:type II toxin-antitoxin system RelE/ParE family toxin [bacterium]
MARDSKFYAKKVSDDIVEKSESLESFPQLGRVVPEIGEPNVRELIVYSCRLIYEIQATEIKMSPLSMGSGTFFR